MKRTQIQLPDDLYEAAHNVAERKEISLAELVRRGLEYMVAVVPTHKEGVNEWAIPKAHDLSSTDPFRNEDWRTRLHMDRLHAAEAKARYGKESGQ